MALFGKKETKEEKQERIEKEMLEKYRLDELEDERDIQSVKKIVTELAGTALIEAGISLGGSEKDIAKLQMRYERAMVEQNFVIIRQLDRLTKLLDK